MCLKKYFFSSVSAVSWEFIKCSITVNQLRLQERLKRDTKCIQKYSRGSSVVQHWTINTKLKSSKNTQSGDNNIGTAIRTLDYLCAVCLGAPHVDVIGRLRHFADVGAATHLMLVKRKAGDGMWFKSPPESSGPSLVTPPESRSVEGPCHSTNNVLQLTPQACWPGVRAHHRKPPLNTPSVGHHVGGDYVTDFCSHSFAS